MARGVNKVILVGNLGSDPEIRYTGNGAAVANISIATTESWRDKQSGEQQERTEWHNIVAWGKLADFTQNYLKKGKLIYVEGRLQTRDWTDNQSVKHWKTEIVANTIQFMEPREARQGDQGGAPTYEDPGPQDPGPPPDQGAYVEDDIPF